MLGGVAVLIVGTTGDERGFGIEGVDVVLVGRVAGAVMVDAEEFDLAEAGSNDGFDVIVGVAAGSIVFTIRIASSGVVYLTVADLEGDGVVVFTGRFGHAGVVTGDGGGSVGHHDAVPVGLDDGYGGKGIGGIDLYGGANIGDLTDGFDVCVSRVGGVAKPFAASIGDVTGVGPDDFFIEFADVVVDAASRAVYPGTGVTVDNFAKGDGFFFK